MSDALSRPPAVDVVIPTTGRPSLEGLLKVLAGAPPPGRILVVDDRRAPDAPLAAEPVIAALGGRARVLRGPGTGPAAARNTGWRASDADWVVFLDDDVIPDRGWTERLLRDLSGLAPGVAGSQGTLRVPLPENRRPTDWERNVKGLERGLWITADMAYRRSVLEELGGFDERFPRAYREDADLGLRVTAAGYRIVRGSRTAEHPVRPAGPFVSIRLQAGNADDPLMLALHGKGWRERAGVPPGRRPRHLLTTATGLAGVAGFLAGRRRLGTLGLLGWLAGTAELAWARIAPGPRTWREVATMVTTSLLLPAVATGYWLYGVLSLPGRLAGGAPGARRNGRDGPEAVLFDRDGTLVVDVPYNGDPDRVRLMPGAGEAVSRLRGAGIPLAVVSNQSGVARGLLLSSQVHAVNRRVEDLLGRFETWAICVHGPDDGCKCRKPAPGLVLQAARDLGVDPARCVVVGDIASDVEAARAAGARGILVPTPETRPEEVDNAPEVAPDLEAAVDMILGGES